MISLPHTRRSSSRPVKKQQMQAHRSLRGAGGHRSTQVPIRIARLVRPRPIRVSCSSSNFGTTTTTAVTSEAKEQQQQEEQQPSLPSSSQAEQDAGQQQLKLRVQVIPSIDKVWHSTGSSRKGFSHAHTASSAAAPVCQPLNLHCHLLPQVAQEEWDAVVSAQAEVNPFLKWAFLNALEVSGSAVRTSACPADSATHLLIAAAVAGWLVGWRAQPSPIDMHTSSWGQHALTSVYDT